MVLPRAEGASPKPPNPFQDRRKLVSNSPLEESLDSLRLGNTLSVLVLVLLCTSLQCSSISLLRFVLDCRLGLDLISSCVFDQSVWSWFNFCFKVLIFYCVLIDLILF